MAKTTAEKIAEAKEKMEQYENQMKRLLQQQKEQERKARTKRLIERGAILESLIENPAALTNDQIKAFLEKTITNEYALPGAFCAWRRKMGERLRRPRTPAAHQYW